MNLQPQTVAHKAFRFDALNVLKMNKGVGSKTPYVLHDTAWKNPTSGKWERQRLMVRHEGKLQPMGLARLVAMRENKTLAEVNKMTMKQLVPIVSKYGDFANEKPALLLQVEEAGHIAMFLPKFHCECSAIELLWARLKNLWRRVADGQIGSLRAFMRNFLDNVKVKDARSFFYRANLYMYIDGYRRGLTSQQVQNEVEATVKLRRKAKTAANTSHRRAGVGGGSVEWHTGAYATPNHSGEVGRNLRIILFLFSICEPFAHFLKKSVR